MKHVYTLLYISLTNELISGSYPSLLQIWSSPSSDFKEKQKIQTSADIMSLCQINENRNDSKRKEFASGHDKS